MDFPTTQHLTLPREAIRQITGFGMACRADGYVFQPKTVADILDVFERARASGRKVVLRGAGRSYGDASILSEGLVLDLTQMKRFVSWDTTTGIAVCEPGVTIEDLWRAGLPNGWWPPVVSGTMFPTLGGALAMNIHGKNNFRSGTLGEHVLELEFVSPDGSVHTIKPADELFNDVISSAGLLGVITRITLQMKAVVSGNLRVYAESIPNWDAQFEAFDKRSGSADYMVSWVDCFARDEKAGRGLFHASWHDTEPNQESLLEFNQDLPTKILGIVPKGQIWRILRLFNNRTGMKWINTAKHLSAKVIGNKKFHRQGLVGFSFLLDYVPDWRNAYLPGGFIQYQSFVPRSEAKRVFSEQIRLSQDALLEPYLGVLKLHRPDSFLMGHGLDGFSLALDYKVTEESWPRLQSLAFQMNDLVVASKGRFYLAKDATLRPSDIEQTNPAGVERLRRLKGQLDPEGLLTSELAQRLNLSAR